MKFFAGSSIHIDKTTLMIGFVVAGSLGIIALWKRWFACKAETWPIIDARIENVFLDVSSRGPNRRDVTHTVLAYTLIRSGDLTIRGKSGFGLQKAISS